MLKVIIFPSAWLFRRLNNKEYISDVSNDKKIYTEGKNKVRDTIYYAKEHSEMR